MSKEAGAPRRRKGEGSISRHHNHATCPPAVDGERPEHKCKGLWRARVTVTVRGRKSVKVVYGKTEAEVVAKKKALLISEASGRVADSSGRTTLAVWIEEWFAENRDGWKVNTRQGYRSRIDAWITPELGHMRLDRITDEDIEALYRKMRRQGKAEGTLRQVHAVLRKSLGAARRRRMIASNPCDDVQAPSQKVRSPRVPLDVKQAQKVLSMAKAAGDVRPYLALMTGLRQGEVLGLRWSDLHLDGTASFPVPHLVVRQAATREDGVGWVFDKPKSDASTDREVPLVLDLPDLFRAARKHSMEEGRYSKDGLVFLSPRRPGWPLSATADLDRWYRWLDKAGVERTPLHAARNTVAGLLESAGVPDRVVAVILGHSDVSVTHNYQSGNRAAIMDAMDSLSTYMEGKKGAA